VNGGRASLGLLVVLVLAAGAASTWWRGASERRDGTRLAALAQPGDIRMLSSVTCIYCEAARRWMKSQGVRFDECFVERDAQCQALYAASGARGTPTLLVRGQVLQGFDVLRVIGIIEAGRTPADSPA